MKGTSIMRKTSITACIIVAAVAIGIGFSGNRANEAGEAQSATTGAQRSLDENAILNAAEAFTKAFNEGNAKAIARQFTEKGEIVDADGNVLEGREAIEKDFTEIFAENPGRKMEIVIDSLRFIGRDVAIEEGTTNVSPKEGGVPTTSRYTVIHVKRNGKWQLARVQESAAESVSNYERLKELEWMVGDWIDESEDSLIETTCRWSENKNYLLRKFTVKIEGLNVMSGTTRIGWDPLRKKIKTWIFDSEGGYAEGLWTRQDNQWIVKSTGVTRDGRAASSTNIVTFISKDRSTWQSVDRFVGGEIMPDIAEVTIVRKPPKPL